MTNDASARHVTSLNSATRGTVLAGTVGAPCSSPFVLSASAASGDEPAVSVARHRDAQRADIIRTKDEAGIYYKDWGSGQPIVFSHGWPLTADAFEDQMFFLASNGYRCIAADRRGHGRSDETWHGNDLDTYADDLAELVEQLDLSNVVHVGHSTGGGGAARYIGRHGTGRVAQGVMISAIPPVMVRSATNPMGTPIEVFDGTGSTKLGR